MDIYRWIREYAEDAVQARDRERYELIVVCNEALPRISRDPARALALLEQGRALAQTLDEPWWLRFFEHWTIQALLFHQRDVQTAMPLALEAVAITAAAEYADFPQRICLREDLIFSYLGRDPQRFSPQIEEALEFMREQIPPDCPCLHCLQEIRTAFPLAMGRWDEAEQAALAAIRMAWPASDYHHVLIAYTSLCQIAFARGDLPKLAHWSALGETFSGRNVGADYVLELLMWQAVATRRSGEASVAAAQYRRARSVARASRSLPTTGYFDALFAFHETDPNARLALAVCDLELAALAGKGQTPRECLCRVRRCRLLSALGRPVAADLAQARALAETLSNPAPYLTALVSLDGLT